MGRGLIADPHSMVVGCFSCVNQRCPLAETQKRWAREKRSTENGSIDEVSAVAKVASDSDPLVGQGGRLFTNLPRWRTATDHSSESIVCFVHHSIGGHFDFAT